MKEAHEVCPRFERCSCNKCPLHKDFQSLEIADTDEQKKCLVAKKIRMRIGKAYNLKNLGLKPSELAWVNTNPQEQEDRFISKGDFPPESKIEGVKNE